VKALHCGSFSRTHRLDHVYASSGCSDCKLAKAVLDSYHANYRWVDIDREPSAIEVVLRLNRGYRTVPTIVFPDGRVLISPSRPQLEAALADSATLIAAGWTPSWRIS
jgi:mycoredoxin